MVAGAGIAPASAELHTAAHLSEPSSEGDLQDWSLRVELHHDLAAYEADALLLSYRGVLMMGCRGWSRTNTTRRNKAVDYCYPTRQKWCPHQDSNLEPQPLEAARAKFVTPCGH